MTLLELIRLFLEWTAANREDGTMRGYKRHLDRFAAHVGETPLAELKAHHLMTWGRTWHQIQAVQRLFSWAVNDCELLTRNPFARVTKPRPKGRRRIMTRSELAKLYSVSRRDFGRLLFAGKETLCRPQEARVLSWEDMQHDEKSRTLDEALPAGRAYFRLTEFKGRGRRRDSTAVRVIPISPKLGRFLLRLKRRGDAVSGEIFRTYRGKVWTKERIRQRMRTARKRAGLKKDKAGEQVCFYTIRHTQATRACARGVRDRILAELLGHSSTRTTARYQHLQVPDLLDAMRTIHAR